MDSGKITFIEMACTHLFQHVRINEDSDWQINDQPRNTSIWLSTEIFGIHYIFIHGTTDIMYF